MKSKQYVLHEHYGYGHITNHLYEGEKEVLLNAIEATRGLQNWEFDKNVILAVPLRVYESAKFEGRGGSLFDGKLDSFDAFDEAWSQWMDALRAGRAKTYIPDCLVPRDPETGKAISPNPFDNRYFAANGDMREGEKNMISTDQPTIPHESYLASYTTALDLCLQGIISPSTLGIDVKKLDNAEAQREKEKATLYTRNAIVEALQEKLPELVEICINAHNILNKKAVEKVDVTVTFGEYANPSFESQVETVSKARTGGIMSIDQGQTEAGRSLGFGFWPTMWHIVIPQAFKVVLPSLCNEFITLLKETSVAFYIGVADLTRGGIKIRSQTYSNFMPLLAVAVIYFVLVLGLTKLVGILERRLRKSER